MISASNLFYFMDYTFLPKNKELFNLFSEKSPSAREEVNRGVYKSFQEKKSKMQQLNQKIRSSSGYSFQRGRRNPLEFKKSKNRRQKANLQLLGQGLSEFTPAETGPLPREISASSVVETGSFL